MRVDVDGTDALLAGTVPRASIASSRGSDAGHPGVAEPHYHFVLWYVSPAKAAALPWDYFKGRAGTDDWLAVPEAAQRTFPAVERILRERVVHGG